MTVRTFTDTITVSGGSGTLALSANKYNPILYAGGELKQFLVSPPSDGAVYDLTITDSDSYVVYTITGQEGKLNERGIIPMRGTYTIAIANATVDGSYTVKIVFEERWGR